MAWVVDHQVWVMVGTAAGAHVVVGGGTDPTPAGGPVSYSPRRINIPEYTTDLAVPEPTTVFVVPEGVYTLSLVDKTQTIISTEPRSTLDLLPETPQ